MQYNESEENYFLSDLMKAYGKAKKLMEKLAESIKEYDIQALYEEFLQIDASYESKKCSGFIMDLLRRKRDDLFRFVINRDV
ncbi:MAG: hypothetical protein QXU18_00055 [Thermoplasmatales archaeon]